MLLSTVFNRYGFGYFMTCSYRKYRFKKTATFSDTRVIRVLHQTLQVRFFLNFCAICQDIKLKMGIDDLPFLHHNIIKAKINDSTTVSVMTSFIAISTMLKNVPYLLD